MKTFDKPRTFPVMLRLGDKYCANIVLFTCSTGRYVASLDILSVHSFIPEYVLPYSPLATKLIESAITSSSAALIVDRYIALLTSKQLSNSSFEPKVWIFSNVTSLNARRSTSSSITNIATNKSIFPPYKNLLEIADVKVVSIILKPAPRPTHEITLME